MHKKAGFNREYHKTFSNQLQCQREMLVFGHAGIPVLFFPTRMARFYDYENWKVIDALHHQLEIGLLQIFCVDSFDAESFYNKALHPAERIQQHLRFEKYILFEVLPFIRTKNRHPEITIAGCSLGGYHALNISLRHPWHFKKVVAMSGRYDLTVQQTYFDDLFDGFTNEDIFLNMPSQYLPALKQKHSIRLLQKLDITIVIGREDAFLANNRQLNAVLEAKKIPHHFYIWDGEAHKAKYWREMVKLYF